MLKKKKKWLVLFVLRSKQHEFKAAWRQLNHCGVTVNSVTAIWARAHNLLAAHSFFSIPSPVLRSSLPSLHHSLLTPGPRWHLPGALTFCHASPCCSLRVSAAGFMAHIHQRHMPGFMGDGVQTWWLWISLPEADLWAVVGYNGWGSLPSSTLAAAQTLLLSPRLTHSFALLPAANRLSCTPAAPAATIWLQPNPNPAHVTGYCQENWCSPSRFMEPQTIFFFFFMKSDQFELKDGILPLVQLILPSSF